MTTDMSNSEFNYQRIEKAIYYLQENMTRQPALDEVADAVHLSPFHFQRLFAEWAGISPKRFLQYLTVDFLKTRLAQSRTLAEAAEAAGLSSQSRVYDLFTTLEAVTPQEYKQRGGITIQHGFADSPFGQVLLGASPRGICWLSFVQSDGDTLASLCEMKAHWNNAVFSENQKLASDLAGQIFSTAASRASTTRGSEALHLLVKGTNFQVKVWEALLQLPVGHVTTYQAIARQIGSPNALQAVGSAVGANHIAYLIPCHRVIRKDGILGEYRWNATRKKSMVGWEMARLESAD
jgi:AraC family transcriptional regulator of adaptative response/methylated-DNA-[protein]-cysteine methyltransferase